MWNRRTDWQHHKQENCDTVSSKSHDMTTSRRRSYDKKKLRVLLKIYFRVVLWNWESIFRKDISELFFRISTHSEKNASAKSSNIVSCKTCTVPWLCVVQKRLDMLLNALRVALGWRFQPFTRNIREHCQWYGFSLWKRCALSDCYVTEGFFLHSAYINWLVHVHVFSRTKK